MNRWALGAAVVMVVACGGGMLFFANSLGTVSKSAASARKFVEAELPPILKAWDDKRMVSHAHPKLMATTSPEEIGKLFQKLRAELGEFDKIESLQTTGFGAKTDDGVVVSFAAEATFTKRRTSIRIKVVRKTEIWQFADLKFGT